MSKKTAKKYSFLITGGIGCYWFDGTVTAVIDNCLKYSSFDREKAIAELAANGTASIDCSNGANIRIETKAEI